MVALKAYAAITLTKKLTFLTNCKKNIDMHLHHHQFCQYSLQIISSSLVHKPQLVLQFSGGNSLEQKIKPSSSGGFDPSTINNKGTKREVAHHLSKFEK